MSNAFAAALWGGDYMLDMASRGCKGVNLHGGPGAQIAASVGDKLPGARDAADLETARLGTFYSPTAGSPALGFSARPIFYGMMLVEQFAGTTLVANAFDPLGANATAYTAKAADGYRIALFNKDAARDLEVRIDLAGLGMRRATAWRLTGPALSATSGVTLAGAPVEPVSARWEPRNTQTLRAGTTLSLALPRASAALLFLKG